jgi:thiol-disulfide isomerase/thioredoxin
MMMKTNGLIALLSLSFANNLLAQEASKEAPFTIRGKLDGLGNGKVIWFYMDKTLPQGAFTDSTQAKDDTFEIKGKLNTPLPTFFRLSVRKEGWAKPAKTALPPKGYELFLTSGDAVEVEGVVKDNEIVKARAKGNAHVVDWDKLRDVVAPVEVQLDPLMTRFREARAVKGDVSSLEKPLDSLRNVLKQKLLFFIHENPKSLISVYELHSVSSILPVDTLIRYYNELDEKMQTGTTYGRDLSKVIEMKKRTRPGTLVQDFARNDTAGQIVRLSDYRGRYVILDFWASWCNPCRKSHPRMLELYKKYKDAGVAFDILAIASEDTRGAWKKAIREDSLTWAHVIDDEKDRAKKLTTLLGVQALPTKVFLDQQGKIIAIITGDEKAVEQKMIDLFEKRNNK